MENIVETLTNELTEAIMSCISNPGRQLNITIKNNITVWLKHRQEILGDVFKEEMQYLVSIDRAPNCLAVGDYVFASKNAHPSPHDGCAVGHVTELGPGYVRVDCTGLVAYRYAQKIIPDQGRSILTQFGYYENNGMLISNKRIHDIFYNFTKN